MFFKTKDAIFNGDESNESGTAAAGGHHVREWAPGGSSSEHMVASCGGPKRSTIF